MRQIIIETSTKSKAATFEWEETCNISLERRCSNDNTFISHNVYAKTKFSTVSWSTFLPQALNFHAKFSESYCKALVV